MMKASKDDVAVPSDAKTPAYRTPPRRSRKKPAISMDHIIDEFEKFDECPSPGLDDSGFGSATKEMVVREVKPCVVNTKAIQKLEADFKEKIQLEETQSRRYSFACPRETVFPKEKKCGLRPRTMSQAHGGYFEMNLDMTFSNSFRNIPKKPESIVSVRGFNRTSYATVLAYSNQRMAAAIENCVYMWDTYPWDPTVNTTVSVPDFTDILALSLSENGGTLAISLDQDGPSDDAIRIYDTRRQHEVTTIDTKNQTYAMTWTFYNEFNCSGDDGTVYSYDLRSRPTKPSRKFSFDGGLILSLKRSYDAEYLACSDDMGNVVVWDNRMPDKPEVQFKAMNGPVMALNWCPWEPCILAVGGCHDKKGRLLIWDDADRQILKEFNVESQVKCVEWHTPLKELIVGYFKNRGGISFRNEYFTQVGKIMRPNGVVQDMVMINDHKLVSLTWDDKLCVWDLSESAMEEMTSEPDLMQQNSSMHLETVETRKKSVSGMEKRKTSVGGMEKRKTSVSGMEKRKTSVGGMEKRKKSVSGNTSITKILFS